MLRMPVVIPRGQEISLACLESPSTTVIIQWPLFYHRLPGRPMFGPPLVLSVETDDVSALTRILRGINFQPVSRFATVCIESND